jgi:DNA-directed RNA polymerase subunit RPC12/RpoP
MKWLEEKDNLYNLIYNKGIPYDKIGEIYKVSGAAIRKVAKKIWGYLPQRRLINSKETFNKGTRRTSVCITCGKEFTLFASNRGKFCSRECSAAYKKKQTIINWENGKNSGTEGYNCSTAIRNYLLDKHHYKCEKCGWGELNPYTNKTPLQIHHIDGNSLNNKESNLQVLCPNCHSLTENFGSRNKNAPRGKSSYYGKAKSLQI